MVLRLFFYSPLLLFIINPHYLEWQLTPRTVHLILTVIWLQCTQNVWTNRENNVLLGFQSVLLIQFPPIQKYSHVSKTDWYRSFYFYYLIYISSLMNKVVSFIPRQGLHTFSMLSYYPLFRYLLKLSVRCIPSFLSRNLSSLFNYLGFASVSSKMSL